MDLILYLGFGTGTGKPAGLRSRVSRVRVRYFNLYTHAIPCTRAAVLRVHTGMAREFAGGSFRSPAATPNTARHFLYPIIWPQLEGVINRLASPRPSFCPRDAGLKRAHPSVHPSTSAMSRLASIPLIWLRLCLQTNKFALSRSVRLSLSLTTSSILSIIS
jgi:hypothetical protein